MAAPGTLGNLVAPGEDATNRKITDLERSVRELGPSIAESFLPVISDLQSAVADLEVAQAQLVTAQAEILALVNSQVTADTGYSNTSPLNLTASEQTFASVALPIPAGYTRGLVVVNGSVGVVNPTGATSSVACRVYAQPSGGASTFGPRRYQSALSGYDAAVYSQLFEEFTGLSGGTFNFWLVILNTGADWGATPGGGTLDVQVTYLR